MARAGTRDLCLEASSEVVLRPGDEYRVVLGGLGSAGYVWMFEVDGLPGVIAVRSATSVPSFPPENSQSEAHRPTLQTTSVEHIFVIEARELGKAEARFLLRRPWEKSVPPVRMVTVHVTVAK